MSKIINFICSEDYYYLKVLNSIIDPIIKYIPENQYQKTQQYEDNQLNIDFFTEHTPHQGKILISHGIADKNWRNGDSVNDYDYVCVSGEAWKQKMLNQGVSEEKILITGYTKLDPLFNMDNSQNFFKFEKIDKISVLYAPTHNMLMYDDPDTITVSCYPRLDKYFMNVPNDIEIFNSVHPANKAYYDTTFDLYQLADVVISGCSSTLYEAWALDIPVVFPDWLVKQPILESYPDSFEYQIYTEEIGYHARDIDHMWDLIREAKQKGLDKRTQEFIEGIFPIELRGNSGKVTVEILMKLASE